MAPRSFDQSAGSTLHNRALREGAPKTTDERAKAVSSYIADVDAFRKLEAAGRSYLASHPRPYGEGDIVIGIGGEVVVPDIATNEFEGDAALDAYSMIGIDAAIEDFKIDNDAPRPYQNVAMLSLRRLPHVFPEINYDQIETIRGMDIVICTTAKTDKEAKALLRGFNMPFVS